MNNYYNIQYLNYAISSMDKYLGINTIRYHLILANRYLNKLNDLLIKNKYDYKYNIEDLVNHIEIFPINDRDDILYNLGGVLNHKIYFNSISPYKRNIPIGKIKNLIEKKYKTYTNFKNAFKNIAKKVKGSGYTFLIIDEEENLNIINTSNQDTPYSYGFIPLIALDLWEHSYYLKYNVNRDDYIDIFFDIIDFNQIEENYEKHLLNR